MIVSINGDEGSGKSTIGKKIAGALGFERYSTGQFLREMGKKRGLTIGQIAKLGETDSSIDKEVDDYLRRLGETKDNFVIDSRMAWHFIPHSTKLYLKVNDQTGAERVYRELQGDLSRNEVDRLSSVEDVLERIQKRNETDTKRYKMYYGTDIRDEKNYDLVLDTTNLRVEEVFNQVLAFIRSKM